MISPFIALDPGNTHTAFMFPEPGSWDGKTFKPARWDKVPNKEILDIISIVQAPVVCEFPYPRGQGVSWQTLATCREAGRFQRQAEIHGLPWIEMDRTHIKQFLCPGKAHPKDKHVREAIIALYGGEAAVAGGKCKMCKGKGVTGRGKVKEGCTHCGASGEVAPGHLYGISADCWAALAVALTYRSCGPSKSGAQLQEERKDRKRLKKERELEQIGQLRDLRVKLVTAPPKTTKQQLAWQKRLDTLAKRIQVLETRHGVIAPLS